MKRNPSRFHMPVRRTPSRFHMNNTPPTRFHMNNIPVRRNFEMMNTKIDPFNFFLDSESSVKKDGKPRRNSRSSRRKSKRKSNY